MLSIATTWLTLLSFAAHAVLGCCAHHAHAVDARVPVALAEIAALEASPGQVEPAANEPATCACRHHGVKPLPTVPSDVVGLIDGSPDDCQHPPCQFLVGAVTTSPLVSGVSLTWLDYRWHAPVALNGSRATELIRIESAPPRLPDRTLLRAWQQSWQL